MRNFASTLVKFSKLSHIQTTIWRPSKMAPPRTAGSAGPFVTPQPHIDYNSRYHCDPCHNDYLDTIYGRAPKTKLHELDILYKKVAKIALGVEKTQSSINVYKDMKWLPLHLRRQVHLSSYMFKILNGQSPSNFY